MKTAQKSIHSGFDETSTASAVISGIELSGKLAVVTGGHSGIGLETTKILAAAGATVVVGARDLVKAGKVLSEIKNIHVIELDLSEPLSIDAFTIQYRKSFKTCDLLINNAGIMATPLLRNRLGYEMQLATNHLGHFQLTKNLWNELRESQGRVICLSSFGHRFSAIRFEDPNFIRSPYEKWIAYGQSKTANSLFAVYLDLLGEPFNVRAFAVHPGRILDTDLLRYMPEEERTAAIRATLSENNTAPAFIKSIAQGAATTVWSATSPRLKNKGGVYCADCDISPIVDDNSTQTNGVRKWAVDPVVAEKLWTLSEELTGSEWDLPLE
jgi:NAD(P)-dependent dehydrogenase (short-subunit alcohol dehydrogenase family)